MQIGKVSISNFRSIRQLTVDFDRLTVFVGSNNSGKSTILNAVDLFFSSSPRVDERDFYNFDQSLIISVTVEFNSLTPSERDEFANAIVDEKITVTREFGRDVPNNGGFSVYANVYPGFAEVRAESNGTQRRGLYARLRDSHDGLEVATGDAIFEQLSLWEQRNQEALEPLKVAGFFGATNVALGKIKKKTSLNLIPAVRDAASDFSDAKSSPVVKILSEVTKQVFENKREFQEFLRDTNEALRRVTDPDTVPALAEISSGLTSILQKYYADTEVQADIETADEIQINFPPPILSVVHRALKVDVSQVGHGLQRAILFSVFQFLAQREFGIGEPEEEFSEPLSDIILLIEEPEIYQHPLKQRLFYNSFLSLVEQFSVATGIRFQIAITTHSEKFISMKDVSLLRLVRKYEDDEEWDTSIKKLSIPAFKEAMRIAAEKEQTLSDEAFVASLHIFNNEISEGFFSDKVVLVEGVSDKAVLEGYANSLGVDLNASGISVVPVDGKTKIDKPFLALSKLGVPVFLIFDNDQTKNDTRDPISRNKMLQKIAGIENPAEWPRGVFDNFAAFDPNIEAYIKSQTGDDYYNKYLSMAKEVFGLTSRDIVKTPAAVSAVLVNARSDGFEFPELDEILETILNMK